MNKASLQSGVISIITKFNKMQSKEKSFMHLDESALPEKIQYKLMILTNTN